MKYIRLLIVINLLYCLLIIVGVVLSRLGVFVPKPFSYWVYVGKELIFLTLLYSLTIILREYGEKKSIAVSVYLYMAAIPAHAAITSFFAPLPPAMRSGLAFLPFVTMVFMGLYVFSVRHPYIRTPFRIIGAAFALTPVVRFLLGMAATRLGIMPLMDYVDVALLLRPLAILLLYTHCIIPAR